MDQLSLRDKPFTRTLEANEVLRIESAQGFSLITILPIIGTVNIEAFPAVKIPDPANPGAFIESNAITLPVNVPLSITSTSPTGTINGIRITVAAGGQALFTGQI